MTATTVTMSSKGQLALPKELREVDELSRGDVFRLERQGPGKYVLERMAPPRLPKATLIKDKEGFVVFRVPPGSPRLSRELVKKLEAETL